MNSHRPFLWNLAYRMMGSGAEADEVVQEGFLRVLEHPPSDSTRPLRPYLLKIVLNLCRDRLRARRRQPYEGPWLPEPVPDVLLDRKEGANYALLVAMERLTPTQRAVWLLREVFDYSGEETSETLNISLSSVKVTLHRARHQLGDLPEVMEPQQSMELLGHFLACLGTGDVAGALSLLTEQAVMLNDGAGRYAAAKIPVIGAERLVQTLLRLQQRSGAITGYDFGFYNGAPAIRVHRQPRHAWESPQYILLIQSQAGRISHIYTVLADEKLSYTKNHF